MTTVLANHAIQETNQAFEAAVTKGEAASMAAVYTSDGQALPPNGEIVSGRPALQHFWQAVLDMGVKAIKLETVELVDCGDAYYEVGKATLAAAGGQVLDTVKYIVIWKQEQGQWRWHRDIWNSSQPA